jgi:hypothetical protein
MNSNTKVCPGCGAPWESEVGLGISGTTPGDRYSCGSLYIRPDRLVSVPLVCRYAADLRERLRVVAEAYNAFVAKNQTVESEQLPL